MQEAKLIFLGTGTSDGVPQMGCECCVCQSSNKKDYRLRSSVLILLPTLLGVKQLLIDTSLDFRQQMLRLVHQNIIEKIELDAIFYTHHHSDHLFGIADLRPISYLTPKKIYANQKTSEEIKNRFSYFFEPPLQKGGGIAKVDLHEISNEPIDFFGYKIIPIPVMHGQLPIIGFRIQNFAYLTDVKTIPEESFSLLKGVDTLVINALREKEHPTHLSLSEAIDIATKIGAKKVYFTHICHAMKHEEFSKKCPKGMEPAYDEQIISIF